MRRVVIGLDPSSRKIALAISINGKAPEFRTKALSLYDMPKACKESYKYVRAVVKEFTVKGDLVFLFIESPVVGRGGVRSTLQQTKANGAMQAGGAMGGAIIQEVNNQTWKKQVVGNGNSGKPAIKKWVKEQWPYAYKESNGDQDLIDAACILRYGEKFISVKDRIEADLLSSESATA